MGGHPSPPTCFTHGTVGCGKALAAEATVRCFPAPVATPTSLLWSIWAPYFNPFPLYISVGKMPLQFSRADPPCSGPSSRFSFISSPVFICSSPFLLSTSSNKCTPLSLSFGENPRSAPVTALQAFPCSYLLISPPLHGSSAGQSACPARCPPASPPTHPSEHGDPFPPLLHATCS